MTREDAIYWIKNLAVLSTEKNMPQIEEALNMAIEALADRKTEPTCDTCRHKGVEGCEQPCLGCGCCGLYEAMTGNDKLKEKVVEFIKSCARCKHRPIGAMMCEESCHYEPKTETQTETQNSNLTFEKDECAKEYEELGLKELKELIEADRKTENSSEKPNNCEVKNYCDDCLYADTCDSKEFFYACTSKATISKMEQVEDEPQTETEIARAIVHRMIDDAVLAEDAYPDLRQKMHDAVDEYEPQTDCAWRKSE